MSLAMIHKMGLYVSVTLLGMVVAALAAYYILVEFVYPLKSPDIIPEESFSGITQTRGTIVAIERDSQFVSTTTIVTIATNVGEERHVKIPLNPSIGCITINVVDPAELTVGDVIDVKGADDGDGKIFPCAETEHHVVRVEKALPEISEKIVLASSTASTTKQEFVADEATVSN